MAIVDTVWGRLTRCNPPDAGSSGTGSEVFIPAGGEAEERPNRARRPRALPAIAALRWLTAAAVLGLIAWGVIWEIGTSHLQAKIFSRLANGMTFDVADGASAAIRYPQSGPFDERLGYVGLPGFVESLTRNGYKVESQAQWSPNLVKAADHNLFPIYREKDRAELLITDRSGEEIYRARFPERVFPDFASIPSLVVNTLLFVEDRYVLDRENPVRNPAVEWKRFALAAAGQVAELVVSDADAGGASTLATQIEKYRHSPGGRTGGAGDKIRQMVTASLRAYYDGPDTLKRREEIVATYLNSTPLASMPGRGEIIGLPDALWTWFGTDLKELAEVLNKTPRSAAELARQGQIYRQVLAFIVSGRRPSYYLLDDRAALGVLIDSHLYALAGAGIISPSLRDATLNADLTFRTEPPPTSEAEVSYVKRKSTEQVRNRLVGLLHLPDLYALDRLDLSVETSIDTDTQTRVANVMERLSDPAFLRSAGMYGHGMLTGGADPSKVAWSFVLYERDDRRNHLRVQADSLNRPFDINSGSKLQLGSTAKLRTLTTYLEVVAELHDRLAELPSRELTRLAAEADDSLSAWAASYLSRAQDRDLRPMLEAALQRRYSAAPEQFFTGGGSHSFSNFASSDNHANPTVLHAFENSINLPFVRIMRDIVNYYIAADGIETKRLLADPDSPQREEYLRRFVETDSRRFLYRYYRDYKGLSGAEAVELLAGRVSATPRRLAAVYMTLYPRARLADFYKFLVAHLPQTKFTEHQLWDLYLSYGPDRMSLSDRGYVAGVHPLELWLVRYLQDHRDASWDDVLEASAAVRQDAYAWLLNGNTRAQNTRIRILLEQDAFDRVYENWRSVGFPFGHLVPSLGTAIGSSGDRPAALSELMGIILNGGMRLPIASIEKLRFAADTPYETNLGLAVQPERVMPAAVAETLRRALTSVATNGTARRINGVFTGADGKPLVVGGKTGTGDNRHQRYSSSGALISSTAVNRTATFVFFIGDRFFGTVTAFVDGEDADRFSFTSALATQLLKVLEPELRPLIKGREPVHQALLGSSEAPVSPKKEAGR
ncbi:MAG: transglycosylase domain-containing protein [Alphaproteobacteria bacterium]